MKGNAIIGQSGGPTSVINSSLSGIVEAAKTSGLIDRVLGMRYGIEGFLQKQIIDLGAESPETIRALSRTPSSALGSCRYKLQDSDLPKVLEVLRTYDIRYVFLIGGNDTMGTVSRLEAYCRRAGYELRGVGIPKTVDNDLFGTDHTPGYPSAAHYVALSVQQAGRLAADMQKVDKFVIHQTVGRDAGWLAASAALARKREGDAPHLIYLPERPIDREHFIADSLRCIERYGFVSIVCGEGILWSDGTPVSASTERDRFSNVEFGAMGGTGAALVLHRILSGVTSPTGETKLRGEFQITESLPMSAIDRAVELDLEEASRCGRRAVSLACEGRTGVMVSILRKQSIPYRSDLGTIPLQEVAERTKPMPDEFIAADGHDVTPAFIDYLQPLVDELPPYARLSNIPVEGAK
jgi:6-phosphofructokinase 1